jgi:hypothetical protein
MTFNVGTSNSIFNGGLMAELTAFEQYYKLSDLLIEQATKAQLGETARLLALYVAHYQIKHGEIPLNETLAILSVLEPDEEQLMLLDKGMDTLAGVLNQIDGLNRVDH